MARLHARYRPPTRRDKIMAEYRVLRDARNNAKESRDSGMFDRISADNFHKMMLSQASQRVDESSVYLDWLLRVAWLLFAFCLILLAYKYM